MTIYSFDGVLRLPRTMHTVQLWPSGPRIPLPRPTPSIAFIYMGAVFVLTLAVDRALGVTTILTSVLSAVSGGRAFLAAWALFHLGLSAGLVWLAMNVEIDGRAPYRWLYSCARYLLREHYTLCGRHARRPGEVARCGGKTTILWDVDAPRLQHGWVRGGCVSTTVGARFTSSLLHSKQVIKADAARERVVDHAVDGALEVRP